MDTDGNIWSLLPAKLTAIVSSDTRNLLWLTLLFILFVIGGAYFGGAESAFSAMNKIRIKAKADDGNRRAKNAMYISNHFETALTTLLVGNNITHIAAASVATLIATKAFGANDTVTLLCTIITTLIIFLFSEMIPKSFANDRSETMSLFAAPFLIFLMKILFPIVWFFSIISKGISKLTDRIFKVDKAPTVTEEELYDIIDTIEEEGVVNEEQGDLLKSALEFSETKVRDVMTMRQDICAVDATLPNDRILEIIKETNHSRLPVYNGDLDHIIGTLQIRNFIREYRKNPNVRIRELLIPPFLVGPDSPIDDLLSVMRQHRFYLAIVADEAGKTLGLITIEDFLEELVGEIWDEDDVVDKDFVKLGGNYFEVNPRLLLSEICERIGTPCPEPKSASRPLLSILLERLGHIPQEEDSLMLGNLQITVETVEESRVLSVTIHLLSPEELAAQAADPEEGGEQ